MQIMAKDEIIVRFDEVSFEHNANKPILHEASFSIRRGLKITLMGQNGAGKSTLFGLLTGKTESTDGSINIVRGVRVALSRQIIPRDELTLTVREFFQKCFSEKVYDIDPRIDEVLQVVDLVITPTDGGTIYDRVMSSFSGGQQARLLLASALIQKPDLLLLDEPTNNLDHSGVAHLVDFIKSYKNTVVVISHDAEFLNSFTDGVLYLDVFTRKIEQYVGNYYDVLEQVTARVERENMKNAQLQKEILAKKEKANKFAYKGGQMRLVAKQMREKAAELEEEVVDVRREDKTIRKFIIPVQSDLTGPVITIDEFTVMKAGKITTKKKHLVLKRNQHLQLVGPNGIGKTTLLETLARGESDGVKIHDGVRVGYYRQDFSTLNFEHTVYESLMDALRSIGAKLDEQFMRATAATFLITGELIRTKIGHLSEGQKGLVAFARLVLLQPGLLILDEPTNHINFRHLPVIAKALDQYQGAMILVSHVPEFVSQIRIDEVLDLGK